MSISKILTVALVVIIGSIAYFNWPTSKQKTIPIEQVIPLEIETINIASAVEVIEEEPIVVVEPPPQEEIIGLRPISNDADLPADVDRVNQLFQPYPPTLSFVQTISFISRVEWVTGRQAYLGDYASHYQTSKHFISRSLYGAGNYLSDIVSKGNRFNVYRKDKQIEFHLVLDLARLKLWLYGCDKGDDTKILIKSYPVCAGKLDNTRRSGSLTPLGTFAIGKDFAVYELGVKGNIKNEAREMASLYGKRWIPLGREIAHCTGASKGLGLHGVPWKRSAEGGEPSECRECIGTYETAGSIRLLTEDIEELYAIIVSKPAYIHIVKDFVEAKVPGKDL